jgi:putative component of toxin-antitoxin plasmid stabilization module
MDRPIFCITNPFPKVEVIILLAGGDKKSQPKDIITALRLFRNL